MFPLVVDLADRSVVVVGAGTVGVRKARQLVEAGARVTLIAEQIPDDLPDGLAQTIGRPYRSGDLAGAFLVVSATGDATVNDTMLHEAEKRHLWINVVDDPKRSNFFFTAVHQDGDVIVSVSTNGASPALAQWIRNAIRERLPNNLGEVARRLRAERRTVQTAGGSTEGRDWASRITALIDERHRPTP